MVATIDELKDAVDLAAIVEDLTGVSGRNGSYNCPVCGSGSGPHHTPALSINPNRDPTHWHCFSCGRGGDVFDLAGFVLGTDDFKEKRRQVMEWAGISDDGTKPATQRRDRPAPAQRDDPDRIDEARAFRERCAEAIDNPKALAYLESRGIDREAAHSLGLGWDGAHGAIVIPYPGSSHYYTSRQVGRDGRGKYYKPRGIAQPIWNPAALDGDRIVVVEGQMDALALTLAGHGAEAVALGGTAYRPLVSELRERGYRGTVLVALDADDVGREAQASLVAELRAAGIQAAGLDVWAELGVKDAGEAWERRRDALAPGLDRAVARGTADADAAVAEAAEAQRTATEAAYEATLDRLDLISGVRALQDVMVLAGAVAPLPTGIRTLDERYLGGGMGAGLHILGAISSMGKTTLLGQIADNVAETGRPVLFVTLEQSAQEMQAKTLSRLMATLPGPDGRKRKPVSAGNLLNLAWRLGPYCDRDTQAAMMEACEHYDRTIGSRVRYAEAKRDLTVQDVRAMAEHMRNRYGEPPLIVIDYLQLLRPYADDDDPRGVYRISEKENTDRNITALRRLARDMATPVLAVSSLNRGSYSGVVTMEAFKESGSVEYGSDVLMGLEPYGMAATTKVGEAAARKEARDRINKARRQLPVRDVELTVIKNRSGRTTGDDEGIRLCYNVIGNYFDEPRG